MPDGNNSHGSTSAATDSDIATLLRTFDDYNATRHGREIHIPVGTTQSGRAVPALAIWLEEDVLVVEAIGDEGTRSVAPAEERVWALDRIRATDPEMADRIEMAALDALGNEDVEAMQEVTDGIDDVADGLPTLEEALSLLDCLSREQSEAEGEVVELQGALRRIAENNPDRLSQRPILPALAKLRLDSKPDWNRIKGMLGRTLPPGLAETVRDKCTEVSRARRRRAAHTASGSMNHLLDDAVQIVEPGPEIDSIVEALKDDPDAALKAEALDALMALQHRIDEALDVIETAREHLQRARRRTEMHARMGQGDGDADSLGEEAAEALGKELDRREQDLLRVMYGVMDRLRDGGAKVGRLWFRIALGRYHEGGAAVVERIEKRVPLRHDERLALAYDPVHLNENVDFVGETAALHGEVFWSNRHVVIDRSGEEGACMLDMNQRTIIDRVAHHIDFVSDDERTRTLPDKIGQTLMGRKGSTEVNVPRVLLGISASPAVMENGTLVGTQHGYDPATRIFYDWPPAVTIPENPTKAEAEAALKEVRDELAPFLWAGDDAPITKTDDGKTTIMDTSKPAGINETAGLCALLSLIQRPLMDICPGFLIGGAPGSGSGAGKGKFVRVVTTIVTGRPPHVVAHDPDPVEREKRTVTGLLRGGAPNLFDNWNGLMIDSASLATAVTEPGGRIRKLGASVDYPIPPQVIFITGNGTRPREDQATRWITGFMDARTADPEQRDFTGHYAGDPVERIARQRGRLLEAVLTILRWAMQMRRDNPVGYAALLKRPRDGRDVAPPNSRFEKWDRLVRHPLLALGCGDPVMQHQEAKADDPDRQRIRLLFSTWWEHHGNSPVLARDLAHAVRRLLTDGEDDPGGHLLRNAVKTLHDSREGGWHLTQGGKDPRTNTVLWSLKWEGPGEPPAQGQGDLLAVRPGGVAAHPEPVLELGDVSEGWEPE